MNRLPPVDPIILEDYSDLPWLSDLKDCPQDRVYHAEGDVFIHTQMVMGALLASKEWQALGQKEKAAVFYSALLHDIGKPSCTKEEDGRITSRGHSAKGARMARALLWREGVSFSEREEICGLIRGHQIPFFALEREKPERLLITKSHQCTLSLLALLAKADMRGRICDDQEAALANVELFRELASELTCLSAPFDFANDHSRVSFFRNDERYHGYEAHDDTGFTIHLMSGLPGSGKDTWINRKGPDLPVISLDAIRTELKVAPDKPQGKVIAEARERGKEHCRKEQSFIWNATNVSREMRSLCLGSFWPYNPRVEIHYVEAPAKAQAKQNAERSDAVPQKIIARLMEKWEVPDLTEAHQVHFHVKARHVEGGQ